jgi:predicted AlkP superfamily pyrophosphatase or phosphodiesterase
LFYIFFTLNFFTTIYSQNIERPKLIVGIVIDQMRYDYLYRFNQFYGKDGFKRLMNEGSNFTFAHYNYDLTSTGPGHASIYTGTTPFYHGIIGNTFYNKFLKKTVNCVVDPDMKSVGCNDDNGERSPKKLLTTTITDQLKLSTNGKSKVISIAIKDRSAILPGGHTPDGAYWYDNNNGHFISSTFYVSKLPKWVNDFNNRNFADLYLSKTWELSLPDNFYKINPPDESQYEKDAFNEGKTSFPHSFDNLEINDRYQKITATPFGDQLVIDFVKAALINENMGSSGVTDFLTISFSSPDIIGHDYGTFSYEIMDTYIKLDEQIAGFLNTLDKQIGKRNYLLFLTADHAAIETPAYLRDKNYPFGELNQKHFIDSIKSFCKDNLGSDEIIENTSNRQIFLDHDVIKNNNLDIRFVENRIADYIRENFPEMTNIFTREYLETLVSSRDQENFLLNGFNPSLSGDLAFDLQSGYLQNFSDKETTHGSIYNYKGTTHGSIYNYDTHVPLIFYGWHIPKQTVNTPVYVIDIAPTIADLIKITEPSASIGIPLIK